ncbi:RagB/SusD family nutrient uptake outer membrane protein [Puia sp. P3]|uniref:RagB/SusD family nutrient uptake outer membrane protein n=1 Tax=Puia sp. P3 TaxID=3423952 RepID=UPI003D676525
MAVTSGCTQRITTLLTLYKDHKICADRPRYPVTPPLSVNCYAFRLTEAYLLEAEAIALSGVDPGVAKMLLKTVMSHAGAGVTELAAVDEATTPEALQLEIVKEYMRNFIYENGVDWLALKRLPFATMQRLNPKIIDPNKLIFPIPQKSLSIIMLSRTPAIKAHFFRLRCHPCNQKKPCKPFVYKALKIYLSARDEIRISLGTFLVALFIGI